MHREARLEIGEKWRLEVWRKARKKPIVVEYMVPVGDRAFPIHTREGTLIAVPGEDYVIKGVDGELYPIKIEIFNKTYEVLEDE